MSEHDDLFAGFAVLEPSVEDSDRAVARTRAALLIGGSEQSGALPDDLLQPVRRPATVLDKLPPERSATLSFVGLVSAVALLVLGAMVLINSRSALAWSDIVRQAIETRTLRCVMETQSADGKWFRAVEWEYDREKGYVERHYDRDGLARREIDNCQNHWIHLRGQTVATRQPGISAASQLEKLLNPIGTDSTFRRDPARDEVLDGAPCKCLTALDETRHNRASIWVDENKRLRRAAFDHEVADKWVTSARVMVAYDLEIDGAEFKPNFESGIKVFDLETLFEGVFPLDKAVHRQEQCGYVFAIHELTRLGEFEYFMLVSFRPTDEARKVLGLRQGEPAGQLFPSIRSKFEQPAEHESANLLAKARANGIQVEGYLVTLSGFDVPAMNRARPRFQFTAHANLWKEFGAHHDILFDVPLPEAFTPREQVVRSLYDTMSTLEAVPMDELFLHDPLDDREFVESEARGGGVQRTSRKHKPRPSEIGFATFFEHVQKQNPNAQWKTTTRTEE
jgi:hypothetical protein